MAVGMELPPDLLVRFEDDFEVFVFDVLAREELGRIVSKKEHIEFSSVRMLASIDAFLFLFFDSVIDSDTSCIERKLNGCSTLLLLTMILLLLLLLNDDGDGTIFVDEGLILVVIAQQHWFVTLLLNVSKALLFLLQ